MMQGGLAAVVLTLGSLACAYADPTDPANGWRGNGTGLWPNARPPLQWQRIPLGIVANLRARANPLVDKLNNGFPLEKGIVREWLVLGPFPVKDSVQDFGKTQIADEATAQPAAGDKVGELVWKTMTAKLDDRFEFGTAVAPFADIGSVV